MVRWDADGIRVWITRMGGRVGALELFIALPREQGLSSDWDRFFSTGVPESS